MNTRKKLRNSQSGASTALPKSPKGKSPRKKTASVSLEINRTIIHARWTDSTSWNRWQSHEDIAAFAHAVESLIDSVGIVVGVNKENLTIVQNVSTNNKSMAMKIPKVAIKSIKVIGKI